MYKRLSEKVFDFYNYTERSELLKQLTLIKREGYQIDLNERGGIGYEENNYYFYKCFCGKGRILHHHNYMTGCGSDHWISCSCKKCEKLLIEKYGDLL